MKNQKGVIAMCDRTCNNEGRQGGVSVGCNTNKSPSSIKYNKNRQAIYMANSCHILPARRRYHSWRQNQKLDVITGVSKNQREEMKLEVEMFIKDFPQVLQMRFWEKTLKISKSLSFVEQHNETMKLAEEMKRDLVSCGGKKVEGKSAGQSKTISVNETL